MARGDDIEDRLVEFAVRIVKLTSHLPRTQAGQHIRSLAQALSKRTERIKNLAHGHYQERTIAARQTGPKPY